MVPREVSERSQLWYPKSWMGFETENNDSSDKEKDGDGCDELGGSGGAGLVE